MSLSTIPSITEAQVTAAVRGFLLANLPAGVQVFKGQANLVVEPTVNDFVVMTPARRSRLATTVDTVDQIGGFNAHMEMMQIDMQLDFHGETSTDNAAVIQILWRDEYAYNFLNPLGISPLYCDDGQQMPFINAESQYEDRWTMTATMQINPVVSTTQQFADTLTVVLVEADDGERA